MVWVQRVSKCVGMVGGGVGLSGGNGVGTLASLKFAQHSCNYF